MKGLVGLDQFIHDGASAGQTTATSKSTPDVVASGVVAGTYQGITVNAKGIVTSATVLPIGPVSGGDVNFSRLTVDIALMVADHPVITSATIGTGLTWNGTVLNANPGAVTYGTTTGTSAQGNDARIVGALSASTASAIYAPLVSPVFTGSPVVPGYLTTATAASTYALIGAGGSVTYGTTAATSAQGNDGRIVGALQTTVAATTYATLISPVFTGTPVIPGYAPLANPVFTGAPTVPGYLTIASASSTYAPISGGVDINTGNLNTAHTGFAIHQFNVSDAPTDQKKSDILFQQARIDFRLANDSYSASNNYLSVVRSGYTVLNVTLAGNTISLTAPTVAISGNLSVSAGNAVIHAGNLGTNLSWDGTHLNATGGGTVTYGATAGTAAQGNDARIVGALAATAAAITYAPLASPVFTGSPVVPGYLTSTTAASTYAPIGSGVTYGTTAGTSAQGNDARILAALSAATAATTYAPLASPTFTGTPVIPGYLTTVNAASTYAPLVSPIFSGMPFVPGYLTTNSASVTYATLVSPTFTGSPVVPGYLTSSTAAATYAPIGSGGSIVYGTTGGTAAQGNDARIVGALSAATASSTYAPLASPTFTGSPVVPGYLTSSAAAATYAPIGSGGVTYGTTAGTAAQGNDARIVGALSAATASSTYAPLASPTFTGSPVVPGYLTTALASSTYLTAATAISTYAPIAGGVDINTGNLNTAHTGFAIHQFNVSDAPTDQKKSDIFIQQARIDFRIANDAYSASNNYLSVVRSGYTALNVTLAGNAISLTAPVVAVSGNLSVSAGNAVIHAGNLGTNLSWDGTHLNATGGTVTYGTTAGTAAQGNDARIVGALSATTATSTYTPLTLSPNTTQAASSPMSTELLYESSTHPLSAEGGIWSNTPHNYIGINRDFGAGVGGAGSPSSGLGGGPVASLFVLAQNTGSPSDVVAVIGDSIARVNNASVFGGNFITRSAGGSLTGLHMVGLELDIEPAVGDIVANGAGLAINVFSSATGAAMIQCNSFAGGSFANGLLLDGVRGTGLGNASSTIPMQSLVNTTNGTFLDAAIVMGNTQNIKFYTTGGSAQIGSVGGYLHLIAGPSGYLFRDKTDTVDQIVLNSFSCTINTPLVATGGAATTGLHTINGTSGVDHGLVFNTTALPRWKQFVHNVESTANAGSDFNLYSYDDTGAFLGNPITITRATGVVTIPAAAIATISGTTTFTSTPVIPGYATTASVKLNPISTTYTTSIAIAPSDTLAYLSGSTALHMTLAAAADTHTVTITNGTTASALIDLTLYGAATTITILTGAVAKLSYQSALTSYIRVG